MRIVTDLVDLQVNTLAIRELQFPDNVLEGYFPTAAKETVDYKFGKTDRFNEAAGVRAFDAPAPIIGGGELSVTSGGLPAVSALLPITESDAIRARRLAGVAGTDELAATVEGAIAKTTRAVQNKYELFRGQVLAYHGIVISENGVLQSVDFDVPATQRPIRALAWTDPAADIIGELFAWGLTFSDAAGEDAAVLQTSKRVLALMLRNASVRQLVAPGAAPSVVTPLQLNTVLNAYGLPAITTYERKIDTGQRDAFGRPVRVRVVPEDKVIMLPAGTVGETQMGLTEHAVTLTERGVLTRDVAPGMVAVTFINEEPLYKAGATHSIGLPVLQRPDAILTASVL